MERIGVVSDVHGNVTALEAVFEDMERRGVSKVFCLGDCVIKCANPDVVIDMLRDRCEVMLLGNCDAVIARENVVPGQFWSRDKIGEERASFLRLLPVMHEFYLSGHLVRLFHASPQSLSHIFNPMFHNASSSSSYADAELSSCLELFENTDFIGRTSVDPVPDIVGYGHLHTPNYFRFANKTIFNPGSVGIPTEMSSKDASSPDNRFSTLASYAILEGEFDARELSGVSFQFVRVPYDIEKEVTYLRNSTIFNKEQMIQNLTTATPITQTEWQS